MEIATGDRLPGPPFEIRLELSGWALYFADLIATPGSSEDELAAVRQRVTEMTRAELELPSLAQEPRVAALRKLFRDAGCDPTRYRPSSEALLRRLLKGDDLPAILPLVDLNNCLSARLAAPCCVMADGMWTPPLRLRRGEAEDAYESLRGPFNPEDKPLLADFRGALDTPITGNERVKVREETTRAMLVAYLPAAEVEPATAHRELRELLNEAPVARVEGAWATR